MTKDPLVEAVRILSEGMMQSDRALLELVQALIKKVDELEVQVSVLMDLHRMEEHTDDYQPTGGPSD